MHRKILFSETIRVVSGKKATDIAKLKMVEAKTPFMRDYMNLRTWNFLDRYLHLCAKFLVVYLI